MRAVWGFLLLLVCLANCARRQRRQKPRADSHPRHRTISYLVQEDGSRATGRMEEEGGEGEVEDSFESAYKKRRDLDQEGKFVDPSDASLFAKYDMYLRTTDPSLTYDDKPIYGDHTQTPHERVQHYCRRVRRGGCNYHQVA